METSTVDAPRPAGEAADPPAGAADAPLNAYGQPILPASEPGAQDPAPPARTCANCGAAMVPAQDWCLQCGTGAPGALGSPGWRSAATLIGATLVLVLCAGAAAYAALSSSPKKAKLVVATVPAATPAPATPATALPPTVKPGTVKLPALKLKPPKIPITAVTPKIKTTTAPATKTTPASTPTGTGGSSGEPAAITLDTNAASTYNPYKYPATAFGDPSLAIDGDTSTAWTAQVDPTTAPKLAEGLLVDLNSAQKLSSVVLVTATPGMTVQVYGAGGSVVPASITDKAWVALSRSIVVHKRHLQIPLRESTHAFRFVTLWISRAPASSVGSLQAPGHVSVNELELFAAG